MKRYGLYFCWIIACFACLGSLYFSEIKYLDPCHLCWYQRVSIYPLVIILGIAAYRGFIGIIPYVFPLALIGLFFSVYEVLIQEVPKWQRLGLCTSDAGCTEKIFIGLGPVTIPYLSLAVFILLTILMAITWLKNKS